MTKRYAINIGKYYMRWVMIALALSALGLNMGAHAKEEVSVSEYQDAIKSLNALQYRVTQENGTETPFNNKYWNHKEEGIYVDVISGKPLFSSLDKFDSGTGWPSFSKPIDASEIVQKVDSSHGMTRTEVRSDSADSHLGHIFNDGPPETGGVRYCINSAALRFVAKENLDKEGYGEYLHLFQTVETTPLAASGTLQEAVLAGGCFWGVEELIRVQEGVKDVKVGYTGGTVKDPTYKDITTGKSGHAESVHVTYDPSVISYEALLKFFFTIHDPTTLNQQGNDRGTQYRSAIFVNNDDERQIAKNVIDAANASNNWRNPIVTEIRDAGVFYDAEEYHQDYLQKNPNGYTCHSVRQNWKF